MVTPVSGINTHKAQDIGKILLSSTQEVTWSF